MIVPSETDIYWTDGSKVPAGKFAQAERDYSAWIDFFYTHQETGRRKHRQPAKGWCSRSLPLPAIQPCTHARLCIGVRHAGDVDVPISELMQSFFSTAGQGLTAERHTLLTTLLNSELGAEYAEDLSALSSLNLDVGNEDWPGDHQVNNSFVTLRKSCHRLQRARST